MVETLNANVPLEKTRIITVLKQKGPSVANSIARTLELPTILTSAILSEMASDKTIKISFLKIGGSPLYYLPGQELVLENFVKNLEPKEQDAFSQLKSAGLLMDSELEPAIRVALRNMKDYAVPLKAKIEDEDRIIWKYYMLNNVDAEVKLNELFDKKEKTQAQPVQKIDNKSSVVQKIDNRAAKEVKKEEKKETKGSDVQKIEEKIEKKPEKPKKERKPKDNFALKWLELSKAETKEQITMKSKEQASVISIPSELGKLNFLLISKSKKLTEADLAMAYQESLERKMPAIILTKKKAPKNIEDYAASFGGYLLLRATD